MPTGFSPAENVSQFRQIAASMWRKPSDPTIYGFADVDVSRTLSVIERARSAGVRLTVTHIVAAAVARAFADNPELNARVRFGGRIELRDSVDIFVSVAVGGGKDLAGLKIDGADRLGLAELVDAVASRATRVRNGDDPQYKKSRKALGKIPWWLARPATRLTDVLSNELSLDLPSLGMPRDPFGTAVVTNVGNFGIDTAFAPLVPLARCPMLMLVTEIKERPVVVDGAVVARPTVRLCASFDHRVIDGYQAGALARSICDSVATPDAATLTRLPAAA